MVAVSFKGRRNAQEDFTLTADKLGPAQDWSIIGVFDGHGGDRVSKALPGLFYRNVQEELHAQNPLAPQALLFRVFEKITDHFADKPVRVYGSTAVVALFQQPRGTQEGRVWFANLGDSRGLLFDRRTGEVLFATKDHKPDDPMESARIEAFEGGFVLDSDVARVQGVLATSRSFGDLNLRPYVTSVPSVSGPFALTRDMGLLLGSDGFFDVCTSRSAAEFVAHALRMGKTRQSIAESSAEDAYAYGSTDNISVVLYIAE
jgi:serine/threonine protein phosphatase PrpC